MAKGVLPPSVKAGKPVLGSCPTGWKSCTYGDLFKIVERPVKLFDEADYQLVTVKRSRGGVVPREKLTGRQIKTKSAFEIKQGDFLISNRQIVHGACALVPEQMSGAIVSGEYTVLNPVNGSSLEYLQHFSNSLYFQQSCYHSSIGVDIEKMVFKLDRWLKTPINFPMPDEQRKISEILACWDESCALISKLMEFKNRLSKALLQSLINPRHFDETKNLSISELGEVVTGGTPNSKDTESFGDEFPFVTPGDLGNSKYIQESERYLSRSGFSKLRKLPKGAVLFCCIGSTIGKIGIAGLELATNQQINAVVPNDTITSEFLYYALKAKVDLVRNLAGTQAVPIVNKTTFQSVQIGVPPKEKQEKAVFMLTLLDQETEQLKQYKDKISIQKQALMQKLLTGKIRVKV